MHTVTSWFSSYQKFIQVAIGTWQGRLCPQPSVPVGVNYHQNEGYHSQGKVENWGQTMMTSYLPLHSLRAPCHTDSILTTILYGATSLLFDLPGKVTLCVVGLIQGSSLGPLSFHLVRTMLKQALMLQPLMSRDENQSCLSSS